MKNIENELLYTLFQLLRVVERIDKSNEGNVAVSDSLYIYICICICIYIYVGGGRRPY